jgi:hypothetical protein
MLMPFLVVLVGYGSFQFERQQEIQATRFALERISDPSGGEQAIQVLIDTYYNPEDYDTWIKRTIRKSFYVWDHSAHLKHLELVEEYE